MSNSTMDFYEQQEKWVVRLYVPHLHRNPLPPSVSTRFKSSLSANYKPPLQRKENRSGPSSWNVGTFYPGYQSTLEATVQQTGSRQGCIKTEAIKALLGGSSFRCTDEIHLFHVVVTNKTNYLLATFENIYPSIYSFTPFKQEVLLHYHSTALNLKYFCSFPYTGYVNELHQTYKSQLWER